MSVAALPFVHIWRDDESLYSWCAAYHRTVGGTSAKRTSAALFGVVHAPRLIDIPTGLTHFCIQSGGLLGDERQILDSRTVFPYLSRFLSENRRSRAAEAACAGGSTGSAKSSLGLKMSRLGSTMRLKACPDCMTESAREYGAPIWRTAHQLPMTLVCLKHGAPLLIFGTRRSVWCLPDDAGNGMSSDIGSRESHKAALNLAAVDAELLLHPGTCDRDAFRRCTIRALERIGVVKAHLRLDSGVVGKFVNQSHAWKVAAKSFPLRPLDDLGALIEALLRERVQCHPFAWSMLWAAIAEADQGALGWLRLWLNGAALDWTQLDLPLGDERRSDVPHNLADVLARTETLAEAALELRISAATLGRWLKARGDIKTNWLKQQSLARGCLAVANIKAYLRLHPMASRVEMLRHCKADTSWLQIHDSQALRSLLDEIPSKRSSQRTLWSLDD